MGGIKERSTAVEIGLLGYAHSRALEQHLRRQKDEKFANVFGSLFNQAQMEAFLASTHRPLHVTHVLTERLSEAQDAGQVISPPMLAACMAEVRNLMHLAQELQRAQTMAE